MRCALPFEVIDVRRIGMLRDGGGPKTPPPGRVNVLPAMFERDPSSFAAQAAVGDGRLTMRWSRQFEGSRLD